MIIRMLCLLSVLALVSACRAQPAPLRSAVPEDTLALRLGERFEVPLVSLVGAGYRWSYAAAEEPQIVRLDSVGYDDFVLEEDHTAGKQRDLFRFTATGVGEATLHFRHARPWEPERPLDSTFLRLIVRK